MEWIKKFFKDESGDITPEYALLVALIAMAFIGAVSIWGRNLKATSGNSSTALGNATGR